MSKYAHLNDDEIRSHIEKYGSEDEQTIVAKLHPRLAYEDCPHCADMQDTIETLRDKIDEAVQALS